MTNGKLIAARERRYWTQENLAEKVGVTPVTISRWEHGVQQPRAYMVKQLCEIFALSPEELGFARTLEISSLHDGSPRVSVHVPSKIAALTSEEFAALSDLLHLGSDTVVHFDESKRNALRKLWELARIALVVSEGFVDIDPQEGLAEAKTNPSIAVGYHLDLDLVDDYAKSLQELVARGEAQYVMGASQKLYNKLMQEYPYSRDVRIAETQLRLGMLVGAAQEYALPWYQRDQAVMQTYNHIEDTIIQKIGVDSSLRYEYVRLLAKRGRQHRVLWQFDECVKECEDGITYMESIDDSSLSTHFLCERAHVEATRGDELLWLRKLEEARRGMLGMQMLDREKALNQVEYMQGEGYKRFAFHTQKDWSIPMREKYARLALTQFSQWNGATIELPGFEALVVQVSKAQCLILIDPDEALRLAGQLRKRVEQRYPALLDDVPLEPTRHGALKKVLIRHEDVSSPLMFLNEVYVAPGERVEPHMHVDMEEIFYFLDGRGTMQVEDERQPVGPGDRIIVPIKKVHILENTGDTQMRFVCFGVKVVPEAE